MRPQICATPKGEAFIFLYGVGCVPCGDAPHSSTLQCTPGPLPTHFSHSPDELRPDELRPDELRPAVFFFFFPTGRTSSDFWVAETLTERWIINLEFSEAKKRLNDECLIERFT